MRFGLGDPAPAFSVESSNDSSRLFSFHTAAGRYIVLCFFGSSASPEGRAVLDDFLGKWRGQLDDQLFAFFGVSTDAEDKTRLKSSMPGIRYFWDFDHAVSKLYGVDEGEAYRGVTLLLDPLLRVAAVAGHADHARHTQIMDTALGLIRAQQIDSATHAPVLILPRIFEPDFCRELIAVYEKNGGKDSGFMRQIGEKTVPIMDADFKKRQDFVFDTQPEYESLRQQVLRRLRRRLMPEIKRAFQYEVTRIERFIVAHYDGEQKGFFRPHRDNTTRGTAHRRFACTLNLNAREYDGGDLRFPEFGQQTYRAPTGGVCVFSCSLLHEATPVTRGKRYAFLPFFYDEDAAKIREANLHYVE